MKQRPKAASRQKGKRTDSGLQATPRGAAAELNCFMVPVDSLEISIMCIYSSLLCLDPPKIKFMRRGVGFANESSLPRLIPRRRANGPVEDLGPAHI